MVKKVLLFIFLLSSVISNSQCITKKTVNYVIGDSAVKVYQDYSNLFERVDTLAGLLTWTLEPCIRYKIYADNKRNHLKTEYYFEDDTIITKHYYSNGKIRVIDKEVRGNRNYIFTAAFYDNGQLLFTDNPNSLEARTIFQYHSNGKVKSQLLLWGMSCWGVVKTFYPSGEIKSIEKFSELTEEVKKENSMSKKNGTWQYWDENGKLKKQITFEDDKLIKEENY